MSESTQGSARAAIEAIVYKQSRWALGVGLQLDPAGWVVTQDAPRNLVIPLSASDRRAFEAGAGGELETKMRAPHSSSALAYNSFAGARDNEPCLRAFAHMVSRSTTEQGRQPTVTFERKRPTGWRGIPPHLDVEVAFGGHVIAVESKMTETYGAKSDPAKSLAPYLKLDPSSPRWAAVPRLREAAEQIAAGRVKLEMLDAPQLIKHGLGLCRAKQRKEVESIGLVLLWYDARELTDAAGPACDQLLDELEWLRATVADDLSVVGVTHQQLIRTFRATLGKAPWVSWLERRYL